MNGSSKFVEANSGSSAASPTMRVIVSHGSDQYQLAVPLHFTFGDLKKELEEHTGLKQEDQKIFFRGKAKENNEKLSSAGVKNMSRLALVETPECFKRREEQEKIDREKKLEEEKREIEMKLEEMKRNQEEKKRNQDVIRSCEKISLVRSEVDKLANKVSELEVSVNGRKKVEEKQFTILPELFMIQLLKLDGIEAEGEARMQRKNEVKRIQNLVEKVDILKAKYLNPLRTEINTNKSVEVTNQWTTSDNGSGLDPNEQIQHVGERTENWESFD